MLLRYGQAGRVGNPLVAGGLDGRAGEPEIDVATGAGMAESGLITAERGNWRRSRHSNAATRTPGITIGSGTSTYGLRGLAGEFCPCRPL